MEDEKGIAPAAPSTTNKDATRSAGTRAGIARARAAGTWKGGRPRTCAACGWSHHHSDPHKEPKNERGMKRAARDSARAAPLDQISKTVPAVAIGAAVHIAATLSTVESLSAASPLAAGDAASPAAAETPGNAAGLPTPAASNTGSVPPVPMEKDCLCGGCPGAPCPADHAFKNGACARCGKLESAHLEETARLAARLEGAQKAADPDQKGKVEG